MVFADTRFSKCIVNIRCIACMNVLGRYIDLGILNFFIVIIIGQLTVNVLARISLSVYSINNCLCNLQSSYYTSIVESILL